jgi:formate hydrogenlyase subunit 4
VIGAVHTGTLRLDKVLNGSVYISDTFPLAGLIILGIILFALQAFVGRMPFDTAEAETEIMEGPVIEYSGPKLALFKYARMVKLFVFSGLFVTLFIPWGQTGFYPLDVIIFLVKVTFLVLLVTVIAATHARYRIDQAIRYYAGLFGLALVALIFAVSGF